MKIYGFWHICTINHWHDVYTAQLNKLKSSGLYDAADKIFIGLVGNGVIPADPKFEITTNPNINLYEFITLEMIKKQAAKEDFACFYIHTKGVRYNKSSFEYRCVLDWQQEMDFFVIESWQQALQKLDDYTCAGCDLLRRRHWDREWDFYSGNFWWARADYLRTLPDPTERHDRVMAEYWVCRGNTRKLFNFYTFPLSHNAYLCPKYLYDGSAKQVILFNEQTYLANNQDVAKAVQSGAFSCGYDHFIKFGQHENRTT